MRVLEAKATKEAERKLNRELVQEEEEQLMEERKKRKDDKRKREAAQKKATEQKNKVPEPTKPSASQPLPASASTLSPSAAASGGGGSSHNNNAKRAGGSSQQQQQQPAAPPPQQQQQQSSPRYPPREVPPRFRHQEQKQLLKRGQQFPGIAANLGLASKPLNGQLGGGVVTSEQPAAGGEGQHSNEKLPDLNHSTLGPHYENSHWGTVSSSNDSSTNWDKVIVDGSDKEAWPSITGSDSELASECMDTDSASSSGSERNLVVMASRGLGSEIGSLRNGIGHGSQTKFINGSSSSNNVGDGSGSRPWSVSLSAIMNTCQISPDASNGLSESSNNRMGAWCALSSPSNGGLNPSTLNSNGNHGAWPVPENNGHALKGPGGSGGCSTGVGQVGNNQSAGGPGLGVSWGSLQENCDSQANGTRKASRTGPPQNLNPEVNGPNNNTMNFMTSSLPNPPGSMQATEPASSNVGPGAWCASAKGSRPSLQAPPVINGTSVSHPNNGEAKSGSRTHGTTWGAHGSSYSGDQCSDLSSKANGDTVNATLMQPGLGGASGTNFEVNGNKGTGAWEAAGVANAQGAPWGSGLGMGSGGGRRGWGGPSQGTSLADGEWNKLPSSPLPSESTNGKKFTPVWKPTEEESAGVDFQSSAAAQNVDQNGDWAKARSGDVEGSAESPEERPAPEGASHEKRKADQQALLQSIVNRADLDPRVLSNSGWGQTPIKQNTAWDTEVSPRGEKKADNGTEAWGGCGAQACSLGGFAERPSQNGHEASSGPGWGEPKSAARWGDSKVSSSSQGRWEEESPVTALAKGNQSWGGGKDDRSLPSPWSDAEKLKQGWGDGKKANPGWGVPAVDSWGENLRSNHWGEVKKSSSGSSDSDRSTPGWNNEPSKPGPTHWGSGNSKPSSRTGWEEPAKSNQSQGWGDPPKPHRSQSWGEASKPTGSPDWNKQQEVGCWGAQPAPGKLPGVGWLGGPMPAPAKEEEPTGWEEPSPESIRRKMEIDDGTSAWGDPSKYNYKTVNMWNKNALSGSSRSDQQAQGLQQQQQQQVLPSSAATGVESGGSSNSGWGEPPPAPVTVDNGTSAWGKPVDTGTSWGESVGDSASSGNWGSASLGQQPSQKPGSKPMQVPDGWCGGDMPLPGGHQTCWEEEEDVEIGMWHSSAAQDVNASTHWSPYAKKLPLKGTLKNGSKQDETWINPFVKQFANLGFPRELPEEMTQSNKMDVSGGILPDKRMEMEKHSMNVGDYSRVIGKNPGSRPQMPKESSMDRSPYFDKDGLVATDDSQNMQFMSNQNGKFPLSNSALPNQALGSLAGQGMPSLSSVRQNGNPNMFGNLAAQPRSMQQSPAQPLNSSQPNPRAQVPPPLLSPQVPVSLLKYAPNNGGLNPLLGPQQVAMLNQLSQLSQLSQISQLQRLLAQQRKVQSQRNVSAGGREQQSRSLNMQQQMMQPSCQLDPNLLAKQQQLHQPALKSFLENAVPHDNRELQKGPSQINAFSNFPIGLNSNLNVNVDLGSIKEPQSRLRKWTTVDSISANTSLDQNASKNGAISSGFRLEEAPFVPYDFLNSSNSPASPPGSIGDSWPCAKSPNSSSSVNWPPEFRPGEPWKGYPNIDPETDPYITPGSVTNNLSINTVREADHLRDRNNVGSSSSLNTALPSTSAWSSIRASNYNVSLSSTAQSTSSARNSDSKSTWSPASMNNTSLAHELWKVPLPPKMAPSRPPPGLTGQKLPLSTWDNSVRLGGVWSNSDARYTPGTSWGESSSGRITNCLVLKNLTPQIDGSTLRTLCMQHGPLITFHLNLPHGNALVRYSSKEEVVKAQKSLHMCVLGNTTILAEFASEEEISRFFAQGQSLPPSPAWQSLGTSQSRLGSVDGSHTFSNRNDLNNHWNGAGLSGTGGGDLWGSPNYSTSLWGSLGSSDTRGLSSPSPLNAFLSVDHLGAGGESM
ncbi:trinucleotide repeat-containing gene 6A protein isoform X3 [Tiliqua scincoides]|uniref:trinucleotide repeat-containing gene 6A protein isoform X3 n=1 Tax=Tiliqua scincoides TaxID=71010 RepID=UPI0034630008